MSNNTKGLRLEIAVIIFVMTFVSYCYFFQEAYSWNVVPRIGLGISLVEDGVANIDKFHRATSDKAFYKDHYYMDKAPGLTFSALPAIALSRMFLELSYPGYIWVSDEHVVTVPFYFVAEMATISTSGLMSALCAMMIFFVAVRMGAALSGAVFASLSFGLATPEWGWATAFYGHAMTGACLFLGFAAVFYLLDSPANRKRDIALGFLSGAILSWAVVVEFTAAGASAIIAVYGIIGARGWDKKRIKRVILSAAIGAILLIIPLILYNYLVFDSLVVSAYKYTQAFPRMKEGFFGIKIPSLSIIANLLFSLERGLFLISPLLLLFLAAIWKRREFPSGRPVIVLAAFIVMYYLIWNSAYTYWEGGGSLGPRFLTPVLSFMCLPLAVLWTGAGRYLKRVMLSLFTLSFVISLMCVAVTMSEPNVTSNMFTEFIFPKFIDGEEFSLFIFLRPYNISGHTALVPLLIFLAVSGLYMLDLLKRSESQGAN